jgi:alpha,alpha-trehalose phosphorylase
MASWRDAGDAVLIPYDSDLGVHCQAEEFTQHQRWPFEHTSPDQYPLLLHFPYYDLYRKQVVKQADLVLAMHLRGDAFTDEEKARNFAYYEALTVRDSSLSACTQAVMAAEVGHLELAYAYAVEAALMDLDDLEHNTRDGLHLASLAGAWIALIGGFGGMRDSTPILRFAPRLPRGIRRLRFIVTRLGRPLQVTVTREHATYQLQDGDGLTIEHHGEQIQLEPDVLVRRAIPPLAEQTPPRQPPGRAPLTPEGDGASEQNGVQDDVDSGRDQGGGRDGQHPGRRDVAGDAPSHR